MFHLADRVRGGAHRRTPGGLVGWYDQLADAADARWCGVGGRVPVFRDAATPIVVG